MDCRCADLAYCAGIFDGEGCLSVSRLSSERENYHCTLYLGMQNLATLEFFQRTVGTGSIGKRKDVWMYTASGAKASHVVKLLLPYLHAKREQGRLFIDFAALFARHGGAGATKPLPADDVAKRRDLSERIRLAMRADALAFHSNRVNSVDLSSGDNTEPSALNGTEVGAKAYRLGGEEPTNTPPTSARPEREEIVGAAQRCAEAMDKEPWR